MSQSPTGSLVCGSPALHKRRRHSSEEATVVDDEAQGDTLWGGGFILEGAGPGPGLPSQGASSDRELQEADVRAGRLSSADPTARAFARPTWAPALRVVTLRDFEAALSLGSVQPSACFSNVALNMVAPRAQQPRVEQVATMQQQDDTGAVFSAVEEAMNAVRRLLSSAAR